LVEFQLLMTPRGDIRFATLALRFCQSFSYRTTH